MSRVYDNSFFDWVDFTATRSARAVLPYVRDLVRPASVVDVGCGRGAWLGVWKDLGVAELRGLDGDYVDRARLAVDAGSFEAVDLSRPWPVARRFDLAQSLEVAEHLPPGSGPQFVRQLCQLSDVVLFSAARPGQGGERHVNERWPSYWATLFASHGYAAFDCIHPRFRADATVDPWYRFNSVLYANPAGQKRLAPTALSARVTQLDELDAGGDLGWRLRSLLLRPLPVGIVTALSRLRYQVVNATQRAPAKG